MSFVHKFCHMTYILKYHIQAAWDIHPHMKYCVLWNWSWIWNIISDCIFNSKKGTKVNSSTAYPLITTLAKSELKDTYWTYQKESYTFKRDTFFLVGGERESIKRYCERERERVERDCCPCGQRETRTSATVRASVICLPPAEHESTG